MFKRPTSYVTLSPSTYPWSVEPDMPDNSVIPTNYFLGHFVKSNCLQKQSIARAPRLQLDDLAKDGFSNHRVHLGFLGFELTLAASIAFLTEPKRLAAAQAKSNRSCGCPGSEWCLQFVANAG